MEYISLSGTKRELGKTKLAKKLRAQGLVPCNLYGKEGNVNFSVTPLSVRDLIYTPKFKIAKIDIDGKEYSAIIKEVKFHPVNDSILHIDFLSLVEGHPVKVGLPIRLEGVAPGIAQGGKLLTKMRKVDVKCPSENLVEELVIDISSLNIGDIARVKDLNLPTDKIEILTDGSSPIAFVKRPRIAVEEDEDEDGGDVAAQSTEEAAE